MQQAFLEYEATQITELSRKILSTIDLHRKELEAEAREIRNLTPVTAYACRWSWTDDDGQVVDQVNYYRNLQDIETCKSNGRLKAVSVQPIQVFQGKSVGVSDQGQPEYLFYLLETGA